jgi:hypothetical protein
MAHKLEIEELQGESPSPYAKLNQLTLEMLAGNGHPYIARRCCLDVGMTSLCWHRCWREQALVERTIASECERWRLQRVPGRKRSRWEHIAVDSTHFRYRDRSVHRRLHRRVQIISPTDVWLWVQGVDALCLQYLLDDPVITEQQIVDAYKEQFAFGASQRVKV